MTVLTVTAGLFLMLAFDLYFFADSFTVCYLRFCEVYLCTELVFKLAYSSVKMLLAKTFEYLLLCKRILIVFKGLILFKQTLYACTYLLSSPCDLA